MQSCSEAAAARGARSGAVAGRVWPEGFVTWALHTSRRTLWGRPLPLPVHRPPRQDVARSPTPLEHFCGTTGRKCDRLLPSTPTHARIALPPLLDQPHAQRIHTAPAPAPPVPSRPLAGLRLLVLLAAVALGWNLSGYRLLDPDEGRNAEVAREMAQSRDYLVPHLNGLPYLDKPIVYFAAAAGLVALLGPTETAARLPAYLATLATVALLAWFARRRWGEDAAWVVALAYATMVMPLAYARAAIFDSTLTLCTTAAILWFFEGWSIAAWAAMGVGALTKGPIALAIPLLVVVPHALATGAPVRPLFRWRGLAAFALVALPWFLAVSARHPQFPSYVFVRETFQRMTTPSFHRTAPFWYFLPIVPVAAFPWVVPALARIDRWRDAWRARRDPAAREPLLLACWLIVPLTLLTLNQSKLPQYVLPLMPAFALAATRNIVTRGIDVAARVYGAIALVAGFGLVALTRWLPAPIDLTPAEKAAIPPTAIALGVVVLLSAILVRSEER